MAAPAVDTTNIFKDNIFTGKVLLCSGGGSGICRAMTEAMVRHGAKAVIISRSQDKLEKAAKEMQQATGGEVLPIPADVRKPEDVERAVQKTIEKFGRIDYLINGAAGNFLAPFQNLSYNAFRTVIEIDLLGTFNLTKAALEHLKASKGAIINVTATLHYTGTPFQQHAGAAKSAIDALTKHWAVELGPHGVRVNGIAPGPIVGMDKLGGGIFDPVVIPLQRMGDVKDIAHSTVFLFSDAANWISGVTLVVDGGGKRFLSGPKSPAAEKEDEDPNAMFYFVSTDNQEEEQVNIPKKSVIEDVWEERDPSSKLGMEANDENQQNNAEGQEDLDQQADDVNSRQESHEQAETAISPEESHEGAKDTRSPNESDKEEDADSLKELNKEARIEITSEVAQVRYPSTTTPEVSHENTDNAKPVDEHGENESLERSASPENGQRIISSDDDDGDSSGSYVEEDQLGDSNEKEPSKTVNNHPSTDSSSDNDQNHTGKPLARSRALPGTIIKRRRLLEPQPNERELNEQDFYGRDIDFQRQQEPNEVRSLSSQTGTVEEDEVDESQQGETNGGESASRVPVIPARLKIRKEHTWWSEEELKCLREGLAIVKGRHWSAIKQMYPSQLQHRTTVQIKDKARNEVTRRIREHLPLEEFKYSLTGHQQSQYYKEN
ncbi:hypothetical protein EC973_005532 [Apophysomyces ossiformis]|uniref:2,4-dienoyl-CoA reductase [(3E)-enoyl-CoA-producing] n=1 Tax=Apophysomyces ossiformis TaxID=679940 RepID=A0A8H7BDU6_9FUNG|nr:hypothetical protein EC973_005532 [Apophysomyces ossiformis]